MNQPLRIALVFSYSLAYCRGMLRGIKSYARTKQDWVFTPVDPGDGAGAVLRGLRPAGVIAHAYSAPLARSVAALGRPAVNVCGVLADVATAALPRVGLDDAAIGDLAAAHLLDRGLRHFGFVGHPNHAYSLRREAAFTARVRHAGFRVARYREATPFDPRGRLWALDEGLRTWLQRLPRPAGVFACNDVWGVQLSEACRGAGLRVPEDVAMLGVDNDDLLCEVARPSLSSVAVPAEAVGHAAAELLDQLLAGGRPPRGPSLLPPAGVVTRQSSDILAIDDPDVAAAVRAIRTRADAPTRIEDVLGEVTVSRRSLERKFRATLARGIWDEIRRVHMERACALLSGTDLPMSSVATSAGFTDGKHLSVAFRQETGMTPTTYRRRFRGTTPKAAAAG